jgi:hypothetical protein
MVAQNSGKKLLNTFYVLGAFSVSSTIEKRKQNEQALRISI